MPISFDLHILGWKAFEDLVGCIFRDSFGQTLQVFSDGTDGGRDAAFQGTWISQNENEPFSGSFCIQCKHTSKASRTFSITTIEDELDKISKLVEAGLCDNYFLITNHTLPAGLAAMAEQRIINLGVKKAKIFGDEWITKIISEKPRLRRLVPRLYGLGDLTQIITHQAYRQARVVLDSIIPDLACFVPTGAYRQCAHALQEHGFVLLLGEPASGKTMIANLMALSAADEWNLETLMICSPTDFSKYWNPDDPGQFLWVDDAFGATQYDANRVHEWNQLFPKLKAAIKSGARVVFTSRDYIFKAAKQDLKLSAFDKFDDSNVVIQVEKLTDSERQMILYNHLKTGSQSIEFKTEVKEFLENASKVPKFLPEIARRFGNPKFTKRMRKDSAGVEDFFNNPVEVLFDVISSLAAAEKAAIGLVFITGGKLSIPLTANHQVAGILEMLGVTLGQVKAALVSLEDSLLKKIRDNSSEFWTFRHPTIRDAYATLAGRNSELIDVYIAGVSVDRLLTEVICGNVSVQGAKIVIPDSRYDQILKKLDEYDTSQFPWHDPVKAFLSSRCEVEFVEKYFATKDLASCIPRSVWNIGNHDSGLQILAKLRDAGVLDEDMRKAAVKKVVELSESVHSCSFMVSDTVKSLFKLDEVSSAFDRIARNLLTEGEQIIEDMKCDWDTDSDPRDLFAEIDQTLEYIESAERFSLEDKSEAATLRSVIEKVILKLEEQIIEPNYEKLEAEDATEMITPTGRSVFDDVDQ